MTESISVVAWGWENHKGAQENFGEMVHCIDCGIGFISMYTLELTNLYALNMVC